MSFLYFVLKGPMFVSYCDLLGSMMSFLYFVLEGPMFVSYCDLLVDDVFSIFCVKKSDVRQLL